MRTIVLTSGCVLALSTAAAAEPGFLAMDRQDGQSRVGGEFSYFLLDDAIDNVTAVKFEVHGQYVLGSGLGFYGALPITYASGDGGSGTGIGDLELGAIFDPHLTDPALAVPVHAGVTLPTGSNDLDDAVANLIGIAHRLTDATLATPEGFTVRVGASPTYHRGQFFGRLDGGIDINLSRSGSGTNDPIIHVNLGAGLDLGGVALSGELVNFVSTDSDLSDQATSELVVGARGATGNLRPYGGVVIPLDSNDVAADVVFTVGLDAVLR